MLAKYIEYFIHIQQFLFFRYFHFNANNNRKFNLHPNMCIRVLCTDSAICCVCCMRFSFYFCSFFFGNQMKNVHTRRCHKIKRRNETVTTTVQIQIQIHIHIHIHNLPISFAFFSTECKCDAMRCNEQKCAPNAFHNVDIVQHSVRNTRKKKNPKTFCYRPCIYAICVCKTMTVK